MEQDKRGGANGGGSSPRLRPSSQEGRFNDWLDRQLHALYDDIALEPLPRDVVAMVERGAADAPSVLAQAREQWQPVRELRRQRRA